MSAIIMDGKKVAAEIRKIVKDRIEELHARPTLAIISVGDDPASRVYVRNKVRACAEVGIDAVVYYFDEDCDQELVLDKIDALNSDPSVHGVMVQLPLPKQVSPRAVAERIAPEKDVDGVNPTSFGRLFSFFAAGAYDGSLVPCTPFGVMVLLEHYHIPIAGKHAVVIGRSNIVGKPMAAMLLGRNATVTVCHSHTENLAEITRHADILVAAVGKPGFVTADMVKPGAAVIDVGINRVDGMLVGDVDFDAVSNVAGWITPVPGGVGPMTVAGLLCSTSTAWNNAQESES